MGVEPPLVTSSLALVKMKIEISTNRPPNIDQLIHLFRQAGWLDKTDETRIKSMIENSTIVVTAWDDQRMVGFARCQTDFVFNGQINNVVVDKEYKYHGIGSRLVEKILSSSEKVSYILRPDPDNIGFYEKLGFKDSNSVIFKRKK